MEYSWFIWIVIYILVGWILYGSLDVADTDNVTRLVAFITWPIIFITLIFVSALLIIIGIVNLLLRTICNLWEKFNE